MSKESEFGVSEAKKKQFQEFVLEWAEDNLRDYPWRKNRTPYRVLISEILLTRTKADQVVPAFEEFMNTYPSIDEFLKMKKSKVKDIIKSLGLLFRVDMLKEISLDLKRKFDGKIPDNLKDLKSLKGIGNYGANAILCFGYTERRALIDSNFIRVYKRVFDIKAKTKTPKSDKFLWNFADWILPENNFVDFNYTIIDIGGVLCLTRNPIHSKCPLNEICKYYLKKYE